MGIIVTRRDYDKARVLILRALEAGTIDKKVISRLPMWGIPRIAVDLCIAQLLHDGVIEQLFVLPTDSRGAKPVVYALVSSLDAGLELPTGIVRTKDALLAVGE